MYDIEEHKQYEQEIDRQHLLFQLQSVKQILIETFTKEKQDGKSSPD